MSPSKKRKPSARRRKTGPRKAERKPRRPRGVAPVRPRLVLRALQPAPADVVDAVKRELRSASPFPPAEITDDLDLRTDLGLTDDLKRALSGPFQRIARAHQPDARISRDECGDLETVGDAVKLVVSKAGFNSV